MASIPTSDPVQNASKFSVEVSSHSHLVFSSLKQFNEVVFWERPNIPDLIPTDTDIFTILRVHDRVDNTAYAIYQDPLLWWVLSIANDVPLPPLLMQPGFKFRLPSGDSVVALLRGGPSLP